MTEEEHVNCRHDPEGTNSRSTVCAPIGHQWPEGEAEQGTASWTDVLMDVDGDLFTPGQGPKA